MTVAEQISAEQALAHKLEQYAGKWVGVSDHEIVAVADSLRELEERLEQLEASESEEVEVLRVAEDPNAACFF